MDTSNTNTAAATTPPVSTAYVRVVISSWFLNQSAAGATDVSSTSVRPSGVSAMSIEPLGLFRMLSASRPYASMDVVAMPSMEFRIRSAGRAGEPMLLEGAEEEEEEEGVVEEVEEGEGEDEDGEGEEEEGGLSEAEPENSGSPSTKRKPVGRTLTAMRASKTEAGTPLAVGTEEGEEEEEEEGEAEERAAPLLAAAARAVAADGSVGCMTEATVVAEEEEREGADGADGAGWEDWTVADRASTSIGMQRVVYSPLSATSTTHTSSMCRSERAGAGDEGAAVEWPMEPLDWAAGAGELPGLLRNAAWRLPFAVELV